VFGTIGVIIFLRTFVPRLLGVDIKRAARELGRELAGGAEDSAGFFTPVVPVVARAFQVDGGSGKTVGDLSQQLGRASIERIMRQEHALEPAREVRLQAGDVVGVAGRLEAVLAAGQLIGREVENREALSFAAKAANVVVNTRQMVGRTLVQVRDFLGEKNLQGVYLAGFRRQGLPVPILPGTAVRLGDTLELVGRPQEIDGAAQLIGSAETSNGKSDLAYHAAAIVLGMLLGSISFAIAGIPVTLGLGGGVLVAGLCFGWLHARFPMVGGLPAPAQWILSELGLSAFAAAIGLAAGPKALAAIQQHGVALLLLGAVVTMLPIVVAFLLGRWVLRLHPVVLLGALAGGQTVAAALTAVNEESASTVPVLGFTVTYAVSNVLLALGGPIIVACT
jgi:AspT/YidE/YbjL antiporter-like protein